MGTRVSAQPVTTTPTSDDRVLILDDPAGSPAVRTTTITNLFANAVPAEAIPLSKLDNTATEADNVQKRVAKAWLTVDATSGTPTISADFNITSLTDDGVGIMTLNFTANLSDANYAAAGMMYDVGGNLCAVCQRATSAIKSTSQFKISTVQQPSTLVDTLSTIVIFGT